MKVKDTNKQINKQKSDIDKYLLRQGFVYLPGSYKDCYEKMYGDLYGDNNTIQVVVERF